MNATSFSLRRRGRRSLKEIPQTEVREINKSRAKAKTKAKTKAPTVKEAESIKATDPQLKKSTAKAKALKPVEMDVMTDSLLENRKTKSLLISEETVVAGPVLNNKGKARKAKEDNALEHQPDGVPPIDREKTKNRVNESENVESSRFKSSSAGNTFGHQVVSSLPAITPNLTPLQSQLRALKSTLDKAQDSVMNWDQKLETREMVLRLTEELTVTFDALNPTI